MRRRAQPPAGRPTGFGVVPSLFLMAARSLARRLLRTSLTIAGVTLGACFYFLLVSSARGLLSEAESITTNLGGDVIALQADVAVPWLSRLGQQEVGALARLPGVRTVSELVVGLTRTAGREQFFLFGLDPGQPLLGRVDVVDGRMLRGGGGEIMVGQPAALELDVQPGDRLALMRREFKVVGIYRTGYGLVDNGAVVDLDAARDVFNLDGRSNLVFLDLDGEQRLAPTLSGIARDLPQVAASPSELFVNRFERLGLVHRFSRYLALLAVAMASLMVASTVATSVAERRQELALLRAVGWGRARVAALVAIEAGLMTAAGALLAAPVTALALRALSSADILGFVPDRVPAGTLIEGLAVSLGLGLGLGLVPLGHALRARPAEALRSP